MVPKALLFKDYEILEKIKKVREPYEIKKLGRQVKNFNEKIWLENRDRILFEGLIGKFSQNLLLET